MAGQLWSVNSLGGFYMSLNLSKDLRMGVQAMSKFRQFADIKDAWGKVTRTGQTFTWDTVPMMSRASRALTETNTIGQGNHTVIQGTLTMNERGFSVPYSELLESLSQFTVRQPIMKVLKYDAAVDLDCLVHQQFNLTKLRVAATAAADNVSLTTNGTATLTNSVGMSTTNVKSIVDLMKGRNIPRYEGDDYFAIARPAALRSLKNTLETLHQYTETGFAMIANGEIGRYENTRFVEQTTVPTGGAADSTTFDPFTDTGDAWNAAAAGDWCFFFGADTVCEALHTPEEIRAKIPDDYGRSKGVAWYALLGYGITHPADAATSVAQGRILKFDSAV
jgi:N4-gp56 family major capsid protein